MVYPLMRNLLIVSCALIPFHAADKNLGGSDLDDTYVKAIATSGEIRLCNDKDCDGDQLYKFTLEEVQEYTAADKAFTDAAHSFKSFASQEFTISSLTDTTFKSLNVQHVKFETTLYTDPDPDTKLSIDLYVFKEAGVYAVEDYRVVSVEKGSMKWSVTLDNWHWCTAADNKCKVADVTANQVGTYLEFVVAINAKDNEQPGLSRSATTGAATFKWSGDNTTVVFDNDLMVDSATDAVQMPATYPKYAASGNKAKVTLQFPKGSGAGAKFVYDPVATLGDGDSSATPRGVSFFLLVAVVWVSVSNN